MVSSLATTPEPSEVPIGATMGGYLVTRLIGRGGMGVVLEGSAPTSGQRVAIKLLHAKHLDNAEAVTRFVAEGRAASRITGRHAVRVFDSGTHVDGRPYLVMELLEGRDLATLLDEGGLPPARAARIVLEACEGMAEVHAHGIVHRDLKPSNLFLARDGMGGELVKVLDFGIAKGALALDDPAALALTQTLVALGTPLYMSPEQIRSSKAVDARSDVWSLGAILYELLTGSAPFRGNTVTHITAQVLESDPAPPSSVVPGLPRAFDDIVRRALAKRPEDRFVDVAALAHALAPHAGPEGPAAAERCAIVLRGALRDPSLITHPSLHDDALGGTQRFAAVRRAPRRWHLAIAALTILAVALVSFAATSILPPPRPNPDASPAAARLPSAVLSAEPQNPGELSNTKSPASAPSPAAAAPSDDRVLVLDASAAMPSSTATNRAPIPDRPVATPPGAGLSAPPRATGKAPSPKSDPARGAPDDPFAERN